MGEKAAGGEQDGSDAAASRVVGGALNLAKAKGGSPEPTKAIDFNRIASKDKILCDVRRWPQRAGCGRALHFLRRFLLRLAFYQRDLLDARRIGWAPGGDLGIVFESIVNEASLVGIHRLELKRTAGNTDTFG